ncbi:MAG: alpha/beta hydrolase [Treponema sp.]|nr:alpha/beta hydrolase [Treponema sp.]
MAIINDRKSAIKKLKLLTYNSKSNVEVFRKKLDEAFSVAILPNKVERTEHAFGGINCDVLSPEIYSSNRVMIYIHGGCFSAGSPAAYRNFCSSLATKCFCRVIIPEFRLAPEHPYPAAIEDIQSVFRAVFTEEQINSSLNTEKGEKPSLPEIIIAGDGSGASILCALIFNLRDRYRNCIKQILLFSPWLNVSQDSNLLTQRKVADEVMTGDVLRRGSSDYTFSQNTSIPFVSPLLAEDEQLRHFPPTFIQMGEKEILLEEAKEFKIRLISLGNKCELDVWKDMVFMFQMADEFMYESHLALDKVGKIITQGSKLQEAVQIENKPKLEQSLHVDA